MKTGLRFHQDEEGVTLVELLTALSLFGLIGLALASYVSNVLGTLSVEVESVEASAELSNALRMLSTELRMSSIVSPYLLGDDPQVVTCTDALSLESESIRFLVTGDASAGDAGLAPRYVGYRYDPIQRRLMRGEISSASYSDCSVPDGDPLSPSIQVEVARRVVRSDVNGDGLSEPAFILGNGRLVVNLAIEVQSTVGRTVVQPQPLTIFIRTREISHD